ncbi:hypothetical protein CHUAL_003548 [Chamberlinius hualienensis]
MMYTKTTLLGIYVVIICVLFCSQIKANSYICAYHFKISDCSVSDVLKIANFEGKLLVSVDDTSGFDSKSCQPNSGKLVIPELKCLQIGFVEMINEHFGKVAAQTRLANESWCSQTSECELDTVLSATNNVFTLDKTVLDFHVKCSVEISGISHKSTAILYACSLNSNKKFPYYKISFDNKVSGWSSSIHIGLSVTSSLFFLFLMVILIFAFMNPRNPRRHMGHVPANDI